MSRRKRILISVCVALAVTIAYICLFGAQTGFALIAWNAGRKVPDVRNVPQDLTDSDVNQSTGQRLSYYGYEFEIPWSDIDESKTKAGVSGCLLSFASGIRILFTSELDRSFVKNVASKSGGEDALRRSFGDQAVSSDYKFFQTMLSITPSSVNPFGSREAAARNAGRAFWALSISYPELPGVPI
jgi:hypothetical protein